MNIARPGREKANYGLNLVAVPADKGSEGPSPDTSTKPTIEPSPHSDLLIIVDERDFVRGCLTCWLDKYCSEFTTLPVADVMQFRDGAVPRRTAAALVGVGPAEEPNEWLRRQVEWFRTTHPELPILMIIGAEDEREVRALAVRLGVHGYISANTMSTKLAAAVLRLVIAGGRYLPSTGDSDQPQVATDNGRKRETAGGGVLASLTPREEAVLNALSCGAQNKSIATQLGMSVSTVKAHVHHIIRKLNVRNRTEAVLAIRAMGPRQT